MPNNDASPRSEVSQTTDESDLRSSAVRGAKWTLIDKRAGRALSLVTFVILGRLLAPEDFGLLTLAAVTVTVISVLVDGGASAALVQRKNLQSDYVHTSFWVSSSLGLILGALCVLAAPVIGSLYGEPAITPILQAFGIPLFVNGLSSTHTALLQRSFQFDRLAVRSLSASFAGALVGVAWAITDPSVWALVAQMLTTTFVSFVLLLATKAYWPKFRFSREYMTDLVRFGSGVLGLQLLNTAQSKGDYFIIGLLLGPKSLGTYVIGFRIFELIIDLLTGALSVVGLPTFARIQDDLPRIRALILRVTQLGATISIPFFAAVAALADPLIPLVFGQQWQGSVPITQWLSIVGVFLSVTFLDRSVMLALRQVKLESTITFLAVAKNLLAFWVGAQYGIVHVAAIYSLSVIAFWPLRLWALRRATGISLRAYVLQWLRPVIAGSTMICCMLLTKRLVPSEVYLPTGAAIGAAVYLGVLFLIGRRQLMEVVSTLTDLFPRLLGRVTRRGKATSAPATP